MVCTVHLRQYPVGIYVHCSVLYILLYTTEDALGQCRFWKLPTEVIGDSNSTIERGSSLVGLMSLFVEIFVLPWLL